MADGVSSKVVDISRLRQACRNCSLRDLCLPMGLAADDLHKLEGLVGSRGPLRRGDHLFRENDGFHAIYAVRYGALKTYTIDGEGREHVLGFHLAGELVGLDAIYPGSHACSAQALQATSVCAVPFGRLEHLARDIPGLQTQLLRVLSKELGATAHLAADHTAEERLAGFLYGLSRRLALRGYSDRELHLFMPRRDIASHLRLATETVSRLLARFQQQGVIHVSRKHIELLNPDALRALGGAIAGDGAASPGRCRGDR
jgi:CRP/FNR family transcriptional regulator